MSVFMSSIILLDIKIQHFIVERITLLKNVKLFFYASVALILSLNRAIFMHIVRINIYTFF